MDYTSLTAETRKAIIESNVARIEAEHFNLTVQPGDSTERLAELDAEHAAALEALAPVAAEAAKNAEAEAAKPDA